MKSAYVNQLPVDANGMRRMDQAVAREFQRLAGSVNPFEPSSLQTSNYDARDWELVLADPTGGAFTVNVGTPGNARKAIKNVSTSTNTITVQCDTGYTIDASQTLSMSTAWQYVELAPAGGNWVVVGGYP